VTAKDAGGGSNVAAVICASSIVLGRPLRAISNSPSSPSALKRSRQLDNYRTQKHEASTNRGYSDATPVDAQASGPVAFVEAPLPVRSTMTLLGPPVSSQTGRPARFGNGATSSGRPGAIDRAVRRVVLVVVAFCAAAALVAGVARADPLSWSSPYPLDRAGTPTLSAVACPSASQCTAVDNVGNEVTFDPISTTPNNIPLTVDAGHDLLGVACPSASQCTAVDNYGDQVTFDPMSSTPNSNPSTVDNGDSFTGVACPSVSQCTAVGYYGNEVTFDPMAPTPNSTPFDGRWQRRRFVGGGVPVRLAVHRSRFQRR
jgi:hypothetical protein